jgi:hypothetical protein
VGFWNWKYNASDLADWFDEQDDKHWREHDEWLIQSQRLGDASPMFSPPAAASASPARKTAGAGEGGAHASRLFRRPSPTFARRSRFPPEHQHKRWSERDCQLDERNQKATIAFGIRTPRKADFGSFSRYGHGRAVPNSRQIDLLGVLTRSAEDTIVGRSDRRREPSMSI